MYNRPLSNAFPMILRTTYSTEDAFWQTLQGFKLEGMGSSINEVAQFWKVFALITFVPAPLLS